jgi:glycine C-acetyltransferase
MLNSAAEAGAMADGLLEEGVYAIAFTHPVVPRDAPRIRLQISAGRSEDDLERAAVAFDTVRARHEPAPAR